MFFSTSRPTREVYLDLAHLRNPPEELDAEAESLNEFQFWSFEHISSTAGLRRDVVRRFERRMILCAELGGRSPALLPLTGGNPAIGIMIPVANGFEESPASTPFSADKQSF